jgi:DNA-binding NarL/FixJ family response regulator
MSTIRIGIAEDVPHLQKVIAENLSNFEGVEHVFTANDGNDLLKQLKQHTVDLILMDINMPNMNGIEATQKIRAQYPQVKIVMLTVFDIGDYIFQAILAGANGYLMKDSKPSKLFAAIEEAMEGGAPMSPHIATKALQLIRGNRTEPIPENNTFELSKREIEILEHLAKGDTYQQIADKLFISPKTVRKHIENIYGKLQVHNKVEAIDVAKRSGILSIVGFTLLSSLGL